MGTRQTSHWRPWVFGLTLFFSALTGFAQMPIFKRYYIADMPGLGWLAQFYVTYALHYLFASALIVITAYLAVDYLLNRRRWQRLSVMGFVRAGLLILILVTGVLLVYRNLPGYRFPPSLVVVLDFSHLGLVMLFLVSSLGARLMKKEWLVKLDARITNRS